jgi:hypothetical protein
MITTAKTKLAELPITWKEAYTDKTKRLKDMYDDIVGSGSYFRFEGVNRQNGDEYYVVCGPAKVKSPKPMFFSGVRKLPSDFSASGKEFSEMREAIDHAKETWGIDIPSSISYYDSGDLKGIGAKAKEWRDAHQWEEGDQDEEGEEDKEEKEASSSDQMIATAYVTSTPRTKNEWLGYINNSNADSIIKMMHVLPSEIRMDPDVIKAYKAKTGRDLSPRNAPSVFEVASVSNVEYRFSMGAPARVGRQGYKWYDIDQAVLGNDPEFENDIVQWPGLDKAAQKAYAQRDRFRSLIAHTYGTENLKSDFYHIWLSFSPDYGAYIVSVGPYFEDGAVATDRFDAFWKRLNVFSKDFLDKKVAELLEGYSKKYGVQLTPEDYVAPVQGDLSPEFKLTPAGRSKVYDAVAKIYGVTSNNAGKGLKEELNKKYNEAYPKWKAELDAAYQKSKESGDAFLNSQPPPPDIKWMKPRPIGQQMNSSAHPSGEEGGATKGFGTLKEAMDFVNTKSWAGCPLLEGYTDVTSEDLTAARIKHAGEQEAVPAEAPKPAKKVKNVPPSATVQPSQPLSEVDKAIAEHELSDEEFEKMLAGGESDTTADTLKRLITLAENLDGMGKEAEAKEIHRILRKHASTIRWTDKSDHGDNK